MNRRQTAERNGSVARVRALEAAFRSAGGTVAIDYLHQQLTVEEAAVFLGTTRVQLYNLLNRREIPYVVGQARQAIPPHRPHRVAGRSQTASAPVARANLKSTQSKALGRVRLKNANCGLAA